jgi:hypothetical protein
MRSHVLSRGWYLKGVACAGFVLAAAGCQSSDSGNVLSVGDESTPPPQEKVLESELRAYCPPVVLREGTAFYRTYAKGAKDDPAKLAYQASITDVTRSCSRANGMMTIEVAAAGRVVTGPAGAAGTITMPIRVAVVSSDAEVLYSQLSKYQVNVANTEAATQFVFHDPSAVIPIPEPNTVQVFVGYDEGPAPKK